jgi:hypothetical protein
LVKTPLYWYLKISISEPNQVLRRNFSRSASIKACEIQPRRPSILRRAPQPAPPDFVGAGALCRLPSTAPATLRDLSESRLSSRQLALPRSRAPTPYGFRTAEAANPVDEFECLNIIRIIASPWGRSSRLFVNCAVTCETPGQLKRRLRGLRA